MHLPFLALVAICTLSVLLPVPRQFVSDGSVIHGTMSALRIPNSVLCVVLHPVGITPVAYYIALRIIHLMFSIPVRVFLSRFGLDVRSFSGTSFRGLLLTFRIRKSMEINLRVDEIGIDVRTMRRLKVRVRSVWLRFRRWILGYMNSGAASEAAAAGDPGSVASPSEPRQVPRESSESLPPVAEPLSASNPGGSSRNISSSLSKRLQIYARGVHVQLLVIAPQKSENADDDALWFDMSPGEEKTSATSRPTAAEAKERRQDEHVLDSEAQEIAAKLAKKLSAILRTYTYIASLFARWVDISVSDVSLMVVRSSDMARAGHGVTLHVSNILMWAESARESHTGDSGWIPTDIRNSIRGIADWLLHIFKIRHQAAGVGPDEEPLTTVAAEAAVEMMTAATAESSTGRHGVSESELGNSSSSSASPEHSPTSQQQRRQQQRPVSQNRRDRSLKYLSSVAIEVNSIRLFPGIEGAQQHMNSRWELVKMLVMQDMLTSKTTSDGDRPHHRGPAINCQRCTIRNDVITTFWGLPKKVDQSIELGQTHVRAGMIESLLDELAIMCLAPTARTSDMSLRRLRALNSHLASVLRHYDSTTDSANANSSGVVGKSEARASDASATQAEQSDGSPVSATEAAAAAAATAADASASSVNSADSSQMSADEARDQVHRMFFQLHEILSKLRLEHVGVAFRVAELVFDLPLTPDTQALVIRAPGMLRWRQRNIDIEAGYLWSAISSTLPSTVATDRLFAEKTHTESGDSHSWSESSSQTSFVRDFDGHVLRRRSKDSTAFIRISTGTIQVIGLRTPSMTPDPRAEELVPNAPGFRLRYGTLYGEMSAFLSEDLSHHPSPQPVFSLDIVRPELTLDLHTQIAIDEAKMWGSHISHRARSLRRIFADPSDSDSTGSAHASHHASGTGAEFVLSHRMHALVSLVFADVKAHVTVERAMYAVRPHVPLPTVSPADYSANSVTSEIIALRMRHMECHVLWNLTSAAAAAATAAGAEVGGGADSSDDECSADLDSFVTGADESVASSVRPVPCTPFIEAGGALMPTIEFRLSSSPISAQWEAVSSAEESKSEASTRRLLLLKRGIRARGTVDLHIGPTSSKCSQIPRINANIDAEIGEVAAMLREYDFRHWLSMQPLWLVTQLVHMCNMNYKDSESPLQTLVSGGDPYVLPPIEERRKILTATMHVLFDSARITMMACDNEEDVLGGIEHGTQICLSRGAVDLRANGGSLESPHAFGFRPDAGLLTVNLECQRAIMFLLAAVSPHSARPEIIEQQKQQQRQALSEDFEASDLCGYLAYDVQEHIVLARPLFNFCRYRLEPYRSRMIIELDTATFTGVTNVSSVYRWSVFMHHIKYWSRRKKLARRMATQMEQPSPPDDIQVRINSEMLDLHGDLVSPKFFSFDQDLAQSLGAGSGGASAGNQPPQMRFKVPKVRFSILKTQQDTDNDMVIKLGGPIATMYGSSTPKGQRMRLNMQPLMSLKRCQITMQFPRKAKKQQLGAEQGVRSNGSYSKIDVEFERGAMAFGHRYNMAETIDGYTLLQKGCKRIARKSTSTCYPPLPFPEAALENKSSVKMILAALGNPRTMSPPPLRSLSNVRPPPPPTLSEPDDIPKIDFHGPEFNVMIHDDPFETALSRIYQVGLQEQRERLSRLEAFETKAKDLRSKREQEFSAQASASRKSREARLSKASAISANSRSGHRHHRQWRQHQSQRVVGPSATFTSGSGNGNGTPRAIRGSSTFTSSNGGGGGPRPSQLSSQRPTLAGAQTFTSGQMKARQLELPPLGKIGGQLRGIASASMQDVTAIAPDVSASNSHQSRGRSYTTASHESTSGGLRHRGSGTGTLGSNEADDDDDDNANYDDIEENLSDSEASQFQRMREAVELEVAAARTRLMEVESREWVRAIRRKMMPPPQSSECSCAGAVDTDVDEMHFGEIFDMPSTKSSSHREQECGSPDAKMPYNFVAGSWTHPSAPLGRLVMSPMWLCLETPLSLLEFEQVESYLRYLDPATPHGLKWTTLIPMHMRLKCGDIRMQLRDFPFPLFRVPDPYRPETAKIASSSATSYDEFYGGIEISSSLIIAERIAHERSLRSIYVPIGPRSSESGVDLPNVGWYISKSLQFPRIFAATSIMMFSAPSDMHMSSMRSQQHKILQTRLPPLPIMSAWGASYQPVISALMQRFEAVTSKSADVSPSLPWWDKLRSRNHIKWRMAVIDAPPREKLSQEQWKQQARTYLGDAYLNAGQSLSSDQIACASERGQMFFLALDGRDPYQVTQKPGSYLFTMRGGVRICLNEGIPGTDLWDNASGRGIYSVPTADATPSSTDLSEFMRLRCEEFLMGVPIIIDRQSAILKSIDQQESSGVDLTPSMEDITGIVGIEVDSSAADSEPLTWKKAYVDLLQSINSDNSARYTFITQSVDRLYFKVMLHLSGGVRLGIGLSSYIPPASTGLRRNHWDVQPIAPESAQAAALQGITDAYAGYRSSKLHTSVSLLCPFTDSEFDSDKHLSARSQPFTELYLTSVSSSEDSRDDKKNKSSRPSPKSLSPSPPPGLLHLKSPDKSVFRKPPRKWTAYDTDALVSPMHSLFVSANKQDGKSAVGSGSRGPKAEDVFFVPFTYLTSDVNSEATQAAFAANAQPTTMAAQRSSAKPQCQISASAAIIESVQRYLPLYVSRMMLPVRKGSLYPFTETSDNKLGKCLRSMRLVLDLKNVELAYSQRDFEIKELETREMGMMGYNNDATIADSVLSPTPSDTSNGVSQNSPGAKVEGTVRELKARVDSFSFNLLMEQTSIKLQVGGSGKSDDSTLGSEDTASATGAGGDASTSKRHTRPRSNSSEYAGPAGAPTSKPSNKAGTSKDQAKAEAKALRWGMGDASTEIDYLDVRLTQMAFTMPLFANPQAPDVLGQCKRLNRLRFAQDALDILSEFEQSWISSDSIRDLKELDISEAIFSNPSVACVLWSPRMVYFTQRPEWTQFGGRLDEILDSSIPGGPFPSPANDAFDAQYKVPAGAGGLFAQPVPMSLDSAVASMPTAFGESHRVDAAGGSLATQRNLGTPRTRALSDVKHVARLNRAYTAHGGSTLSGRENIEHGNSGSASAVPTRHRRNTSMPWLLTKNPSLDGTVHDMVSSNRAPPPSALTSATTQQTQHQPQRDAPPSPQQSFFGNIQSVSSTMQRSTTQPNVSSVWLQQRQPSESGSAGPSPLLQPHSSQNPPPINTMPTEVTVSDISNEVKTPSSAMSYKSSFHLLELARSRQRRLTTSNSRQSISLATGGAASTNPVPEPQTNYTLVDLQRQPSLALDSALSNTQTARLAPTGPDPNVIMRDSRTTQAMLLQKRKLMLGTAIQHEQASLAHLSREFERASSRHSEDFRKEMVRRAEHIYELGARRKLINRCLRFLGVDPDVAESEQMAGISEPAEDDLDFDRDTQEVEKVLATLYRHRFLIYSGYLIWTTQVRDKLMRFLYIQDCLTAIEYYLSESATKVVRTVTSAKSNASDGISDSAAGGVSATDIPEQRSRRGTMASGRNRAMSNASADRTSTGGGKQEASSARYASRSHSPRSRRQSSDQRSVASGSSRHTTLHLPKILRRLKSHEKLGGGHSKSNDDSSGFGFLFRSKKSSQKQQQKQQQQQKKQQKQQNKKSRKTKEDYKMSKRSVGKNKFDRGLKSVWDDFVRYHPYYSVLVEFLNSQVSMRVDEKTSTTSAIAVAERVQLHRILLCNEDNVAEDTLMLGTGDLGQGFAAPPNDESIVKTRSLVELENVQVFTAKRDDFEQQAAYFVDCTYGSRMEGDASEPTTIWPAWIPIELLLSQGKHRARGIFDELTEAGGAGQQKDTGNGTDMSSENDSDTSESVSPGTYDDAQQTTSGSAKKRKHRKAWWLEDLSKYKRLMDRNNGLVVYDKANPHRIQGDSAASSDAIDPVSAGVDLGGSAAAEIAGRASADRRKSSMDRSVDADAMDSVANDGDVDDSSDDDSDDGADAGDDNIDFDEFDGVPNGANGGGSGSQGLSHRANHFAVFLPELNMACTAEQYTAVYETVTELLVFIDPEKAAYMDHLNTILLGMDMDDLRGLLTVISATQEALRERLPIIHDWYAIQRSHVVLLREVSSTVAADIDARRQKSRAMSLLTLDRHRRALELQLRTAMDLFGAAQKQMRQQHRLEELAAAAAAASARAPAEVAGADGGSVPLDRGTSPSRRAAAAPSSADQGSKTEDQHNPRSRANTAQSAGSALLSSITGGRKKPLAASLSSSSSSSSSSGMRSIESAQTTIARTIHLFISKATWHMLENDGQPLCDTTLRWATLKAVTTSDQATHLLSEVHLLYVVNRLPNPMFTDLVGPYVRPKHPRPDFCVERMIRVRWSELAPVGGISIVERFEVDLFPLRLQLSHDIAQKLVNYLYPPQDPSNATAGGVGNSKTDMTVPESGSARNRRPTVSSISSVEGPGGAYQPSMLSPVAGSTSSMTAAAVSPSAAPVPPPLSGGGSPTMFADGQGSGRSMLVNRVMRRNVADESIRSSPVADDRQPKAPFQMSPQGASMGLLATMSGRSTPFSLFSENNSMINISQTNDNRVQVDQMKKRASSNKTFLNIKIGGSTLCISYQGKKTNNITDLRDFEFHAPRLELRNQVESYYELLMQVKKEYMSVVVQHTGALVKEKFRQLHNRKAWSKTSFGPDWEARRLLIDMDRRVDEDMAASIHGSSMSEREAFPEISPPQQPTVTVSEHDELPADLGSLEPRSRMPSVSASAATSRSASNWAGESPAVAPSSSAAAAAAAAVAAVAAAASGVESNDDSASMHSTKGKAPLSKYMILDPRKLMGKRIPNVLPRNFARASESASASASASRSQTPAQSVPSSARFAQQGVGEGGSAPPTSPASSVSSSFRPQLYSSMHLDMMSLSPSPTPSPRRNNPGSREHRSPSISPQDDNGNN